jgi:hypothetical protein
MQMGISVYWRFKGTKSNWHYGWPTSAGPGLVRIGGYNGDKGGIVVSQNEIEVRPYH